MSDHVSERGATCGAQKKNVLYGTWVCERARSWVFFFFFFQNVSVDSQDTSSFLMNVCCNLNTEQCESESLCSHSKKILTFLDNDRVNLGSSMGHSFISTIMFSRLGTLSPSDIDFKMTLV